MAKDECPRNPPIPGEDPEFQAATWKLQRWLKGALFIVVFAAVGGAFGGSPWLDRLAKSGEFEIRYPFLIRQQNAIEWRIALTGTPEIWFDHELIDAFDIEIILPDPDTKSSDHDRLTLRFPPGTRDVRLRMRAKQWGEISGNTGSGGASTPVSIWGWP